MAKKCLTAKAKKCVFIQNTNHRDIFEVSPESGSNLPFTYFKRSLPYSANLIAQKAVYVVESAKDCIKVLNTGLRKTQNSSIFYGDKFNPLTKVCSLILFCFDGSGETCTVYLFENYYPRNLDKVIKSIQAL